MAESKNELVRNRIARERKSELETYQRELDKEWMNSRIEDGRMASLMAKVREEEAMEKEYRERTDHAAIVNAKARQEINLAMEIAKQQREEIRAYQRRHILRENDQSLKMLTRQLHAGYVCRDLQLQIQNNRYRQLQDKEDDRHASEVLARALYTDRDAVERELRLRKKQEYKHGQELRQQLVSRQYQKHCEYEDTLIEKKMLDDILKTVADEDKRELQMKHELREKSRYEMQTFKAAKDAWLAKHKDLVIKEEKEIEKQQKELCDREAAIIAERKRREAEKERIVEMIANKIAADEDKRTRRENIIKLLQEQEFLEQNLQDDIESKIKLERVKRETKDSLMEQMETRRRQEQQEKEREYRYLQELREKQKIEEEQEKEKQAQIREKNRIHCELLLKQAEEQRRKAKGDKDDEERRAKALQDYSRSWSEEIKEERKKIIKGHVPHLLGYLKAGVVQVEDLPAVKEGLKEKPELAHLDIDALTSTVRPKRYPKCNAQCRVLREY